jgi:8-oxo-dGTP pyrophosphatase MutT (NUDIX family)
MYIKNKKRVYSGKVINVDQVQLDFDNNKIHNFELISFDVITGVSALPIVDNDVMLIKHYQLGIDDIGWSLPTGGLHKNEDPHQRMQLELQEELGFKANKLTLMTRIHTLPGYVSTEPGYIFLAQDLIPSSIEGDEPYPIEVVTLPIKHALALIQKSEIKDGRTILALLYYLHFVKNGRIT